VAVAVGVSGRWQGCFGRVCNGLGYELPLCHCIKFISPRARVDKKYFLGWQGGSGSQHWLVIAVAVNKHNALGGVPVVPQCGVPLFLG
jgi:hypothetical protein